jgi:hypothetical protein
MKKLSLTCLLLGVVAITSLDAAVYKGQREYIKKCRKCHGEGQKLLASRDMEEWETLMRNKGKVLATIHLKNEEAEKSWDYFKSDKYRDKAKHLEDFMMEYASDSGNVPACN